MAKMFLSETDVNLVGTVMVRATSQETKMRTLKHVISPTVF